MNRLTDREDEIARRVRGVRESLNPRPTQEEMGQALGLSQVGYSHYEACRVPFTIEQLFILSRILGRSVEYFLGLDNGLTEEEDELLTRYKALPPNLARWLLDSLRGAMRGQDE